MSEGITLRWIHVQFPLLNQYRQHRHVHNDDRYRVYIVNIVIICFMSTLRCSAQHRSNRCIHAIYIRDQLSLVTLRVLAAWLDTGRARMGTAIGPGFLALHCGRAVCQVKTC